MKARSPFSILTRLLIPAAATSGCLALVPGAAALPLAITAASCLTAHQSSLVLGAFCSRTDLFFPSLRGEGFVRRSSGPLLRFDDGPHPEWTPRILDLLGEHAIKALFFLVGNHARKHPDLVCRIHAEGHVIGNHTLSHPYKFVFLGPRALESEIGTTNHILRDITGIDPEFFAAPMGHRTPWMQPVLERHALTSVMWDLNSHDTRAEADEIVRNISRRLEGQKLILFHDGVLPLTRPDRESTVVAVQQLILEAGRRGIPFALPESSPSPRHARS